MEDFENSSLSCEELDEQAPEQEAETIEEKLITENIETPIKLDYKLKTCEERAQLVQRILQSQSEEKITNRYLEILGDYIMDGITKEEKREKKFLTDNRLMTIYKRETSLEGLSEKFENGEDGIYNLIINDKNIFLSPKISITQEDIDTIPGLRELREDMAQIEQASKSAMGKKKYLLKKQLIEMRKDQYVLKSIFKPIANFSTSYRSVNKIDLTSHCWVDKNGEPQNSGLISFFNPKHISALLCNYSALKTEVHAKYSSDFYYLMEDFDKLVKKALADYPLYLDIVKLKAENKSGIEIQQFIKEKYDISYTTEYISVLWRNKIPKIIADKEKDDFLIWYYTYEEYGKWKRCSCCGEIKLAHNRFFSKNKTSKDGFYSQCKACRNKKTLGKNNK